MQFSMIVEEILKGLLFDINVLLLLQLPPGPSKIYSNIYYFRKQILLRQQHRSQNIQNQIVFFSSKCWRRQQFYKSSYISFKKSDFFVSSFLGLNIQYNFIKEMSNLGNYSPFNRSYQFMHIQNTVYHLKNRLSARSLVKTNLSQSRRLSLSHTKNKTSQISQRYLEIDQHRPLSSGKKGQTNKEEIFQQPHRIIHKNQIVERAKSARVSRENFKIVERLVGTECLITDKIRAQQFYNNHQRYKRLRRKFQEGGQRKVTPLGNLKLLNPTIASFRTSHQQNRHKQSDLQQWFTEKEWVA